MTMEGKRISLSPRHSLEEKEDRISNLPDNLIHEILSYVGDTKHAVRTSVLSKRWKNIWKSLPFLTLDWVSSIEERYMQSYVNDLGNGIQDRFLGFAEKVFEFRDECNIQKIKLGLFVFDFTSLEALSRWIRTALNHNVRDLEINVVYRLDSAYEIPHQLLNCKSLRTLCFTSIGDRYMKVRLPKSISLPQIEKLHLNGIFISILELHRLFSSCPVIEDVLVEDCNVLIGNQMNILIDSRSLRVFALINNRHTRLRSADDFLTCTIKVSAPNVIEFRCTSFMTYDFSLEYLSSIVSADLDMKSREEEEEGVDETADTYSELPAEEMEAFAQRTMKILGVLEKVHHLTLSSGFLEVLLQAPGTLYLEPPQLCNLKSMKLEMRLTRGCLQSIAYLLNVSPTIRSLVLTSMESNLPDIGDWEAVFSLTCSFPHLKSVEIREVEGCDNELKFLTSLLKRTTVLENLNLDFRATSNSRDRARQLRWFKRNLEEFTRPPSRLKLTVCQPFETALRTSWNE